MIDEYRKSERGSAGAKLVMVLAVLILAGNAGINYVPVAYQGASFKQELQTIVVSAVAMPVINKSAVDVAKEKIAGYIRANGIPANTFVEVKQNGNLVTARVAYTQPVNILPFGIYTYNYQFDHTATPGGFLAK